MKRICLLVAIAIAVHVNSQNLDQGLVAYWPISGNPLDSTPNGFNGTLIGSPTLVSGYNNAPNSAYYFNGTSQMIDFGDILDSVFARNPKGQFTITGWAKSNTITSTSGAGLIIAKQAGGNGPDQWSVSHFTDGTVRGIVKTSTLLDFLEYKTADSIPINQWFSFALIFDGTAVSTASRVVFFVNGNTTVFSRINGTFGTTCINTPQHITVGAGHVAGNPTIPANQYNGAVDELRIYNRILTGLEINTLSKLPNTGLSEINKDVRFSLYPNPTKDGLFNIHSELEINKVNVYSTDLKRVQTCESNCNIIKLEANGVYIVEVITHDVVKYFKLIY